MDQEVIRWNDGSQVWELKLPQSLRRLEQQQQQLSPGALTAFCSLLLWSTLFCSNFFCSRDHSSSSCPCQDWYRSHSLPCCAPLSAHQVAIVDDFELGICNNCRTIFLRCLNQFNVRELSLSTNHGPRPYAFGLWFELLWQKGFCQRHPCAFVRLNVKYMCL